MYHLKSNKKVPSAISPILSFLIVMAVFSLFDIATSGYITTGLIRYITFAVVITAAIKLRQLIESIILSSEKE